MDEFNNPYWGLDEVFAWAETRSPDLVRFAGIRASPNQTASSSDIAARCSSESIQRKNAGRDINEELWLTSGWTKRNPRQNRLIEHLAPNIKIPLPFENGYEETLRRLADEGKIRIADFNLFPTRDYMLHLLQLGELTAIGKSPGAPLSRQIEPKEFVGTEIAAHGRSGRMAVWRRGKVGDVAGGCFDDVHVPREDVLRLFPADAPPSAPNLEALLRDAVAADGPLSQANAVRIARRAGVKDSREKIREALKAIQGPQKPGPRGPRRNRAARSA